MLDCIASRAFAIGVVRDDCDRPPPRSGICVPDSSSDVARLESPDALENVRLPVPACSGGQSECMGRRCGPGGQRSDVRARRTPHSEGTLPRLSRRHRKAQRRARPAAGAVPHSGGRLGRGDCPRQARREPAHGAGSRGRDAAGRQQAEAARNFRARTLDRGRGKDGTRRAGDNSPRIGDYARGTRLVGLSFGAATGRSPAARSRARRSMRCC